MGIAINGNTFLSYTAMAMLPIFILLFSLPYAVNSFSNFNPIYLPPPAVGPESVAVDLCDPTILYVTVDDGRILKRFANGTFIDFAYTSSERTKACDGVSDPNLGPICGRPIDLSFHSGTCKLYIADSFLGLFVVGPEGGLATSLATSAEGVRFHFLSGVDVHQATETVYFSDVSETFDLRNIYQPGFTDDSTGRLLMYEPCNKEVTVLLRNLSGASGPAVSWDGLSVVVSERDAHRILKVCLLDLILFPNQAEVILNLTEYGSKIKRSPRGGFWVAENRQLEGQTTPIGSRFDDCGQVLETMNFNVQYHNINVRVIQEHNGILYIGSRQDNFGSRQDNFIGEYSN